MEAPEAAADDGGEAQPEEPRFRRLQRVLVAQTHASEKPIDAVCLGKNDDGSYRVGLVLPDKVCRVADGVAEADLTEALRYQRGDRVRVQREDGSYYYGFVEEAVLPVIEAEGAAEAEEAPEGEEQPAEAEAHGAGTGSEEQSRPSSGLRRQQPPGAGGDGASGDAAPPAAGQDGEEEAAVPPPPRYELDEDGFVVGGTFRVRDALGEAPDEEGITADRLCQVGDRLARDTLVCVELRPASASLIEGAAAQGSGGGAAAADAAGGGGPAAVPTERFWAVIDEETSVGMYKVSRTIDGEVVRGVDILCITEVEPFQPGQEVKVRFDEGGKFYGVVEEETSPGVYTVRRNIDQESIEFCDGCAMEVLREPIDIVEVSERVSAELRLVADDVNQRMEQDDLLPSIGDRGVERRVFLRGQVDALASQRETLNDDRQELHERAVEAEYFADEAARELLPPELPEGEVAPPPVDEVPWEMMSPEEREESQRKAAELLAKQEEANRLATVARRMRKLAKRAEKAFTAGDKAATEVREAAEATEAELEKRTTAAARKAFLWAKARKEEAACAIVWLHGQGECEASWQTTLSDVQVSEEVGACRWIWPRAPMQPCSTRGGVLTPQWFDTPEFPKTRVVRGVPDRPTREEEPRHLTEATRRIHAVLEALEAEGVPSERILLAGFGQGAALVPHAVLRFQRPLAGGAMLCGWVPCREALDAAADKAAPPEGRPVPPEFLWCAGARDAVVDPTYAAEQALWLKEIGANVDFRMFPELAFGVNQELLTSLQAWLTQRLLPPELRERPPSGSSQGGGGSQRGDVAGDPSRRGSTTSASPSQLPSRRGSTASSAPQQPSRQGSKSSAVGRGGAHEKPPRTVAVRA